MTYDNACEAYAAGVNVASEGVPLAFDPVCGCDEETYTNECFAAGEAVNVATMGDCADPGR